MTDTNQVVELAAKLEKAIDTVKAQGTEYIEKSARLEKQSAANTEQLDSAIITLNETRAELAAVKQAMAGAQPDAKPERNLSAGQQFAAKAAEFNVNDRSARLRLQTKAGEIMNSATSKPLGGVTDLGMRPIIDLPLTIRDLVSEISISTDSVEFTYLNSFTNAAAPVAEGAKKPQSTLDFAVETLPTRVIAHFIKASRQVMSDNSFLQGIIDGRLRRGLAAVVEQQLLLGDGLGQNLKGLLPNATAFVPANLVGVTTPNKLDVMRMAMLQTLLAGYNSNGIVLNPLDAAVIALTKDDVGGYLISNPTQAQGGMTLWGIPVVESNSMTADDFLVGDFAQAELYSRWETTVEAGFEMDDFTKNMVTILAENRLALGIVDKAAFIKGDFATALA